MIERIRGWSLKRRYVALAAPLLLLVALGFAWPALDAWARSAALFMDTVLPLPVRPLTWVTGDPTRQDVEWGASGGRGLLVRPAGAESAPALIVIGGTFGPPPDGDRVGRLLDALARTGFTVLLTLSDELEARRVEAVEVERLVEAFQFMERDLAVNKDRIAFIGLSVGGSLALVASADARINDRVWFVQAIGPYYDATSLAASVVSREFRTPAGIEQWEPEQFTRAVVTRTLPLSLSVEQRQTLAGSGLEAAERLLAQLTPEQRVPFDAISPSAVIDGLRAPLYLLHGRNDPFVPWTESEALAAAYPPAVYHQLELLEHVEPRPGDVRVLLRDGWRLLRLFSRIYQDAR